mgnify:CR=1 FL=1
MGKPIAFFINKTEGDDSVIINYTLRKKERKTGIWKYRVEKLDDVKIEKGENFFYTTNEDKYKDLNCIKINTMFYDIEDVTEGKVILKETLPDGYEGEVFLEAQLPIVIRSTKQIEEIKIMARQQLAKVKSKAMSLAQLTDRNRKLELLETIREERNDHSLQSAQITLYTIDEADLKANEEKNNLLLYILSYAMYIDMDYVNNGKTLWQELGIQKDNWIQLTDFLSSENVSILADDEDINKLKFTIEAIKLDRNVEEYMIEQLKTQFEQYQAQITLQQSLAKKELRKYFNTDEELEDYIKTLESSPQTPSKPVSIKKGKK